MAIQESRMSLLLSRLRSTAALHRPELNWIAELREQNHREFARLIY